MKKIIILLLIISLFFFTGCNKYHGFDYNSSTNSECLVQCETLMNQYKCFEATPSYQSQYINELQTKGSCSCYIRSCFK